VKFIEDLKTNVYCRLAVSKIHGVGVFAIRPIPQGVDPMAETRNVTFYELPVRAIRDSENLTPAVKQLVKDLCPEEAGNYIIPDHSLNEIGLSYYLNHSETPNMVERDGYFVTARDIAEGEELTVDYCTYGELNL
jgi:SET domain-containing protein